MPVGLGVAVDPGAPVGVGVEVGIDVLVGAGVGLSLEGAGDGVAVVPDTMKMYPVNVPLSPVVVAVVVLVALVVVFVVDDDVPKPRLVARKSRDPF